MNKRIVLVALALILVSILLVGTPPARNILRQGAVALLALVPTYISSPVATSTYTITPPSTEVRFDELTWKPGVVNNDRDFYPNTLYINGGTYANITDTLTSSGGGKSVKFGFDANGGGYDWSVKLYGYSGFADGFEMGAVAYGRGLLGAILDHMHRHAYNPEQAGGTDLLGAPTKVVASPGAVLVPQFVPPLWGRPDFPFTAKYSDFDLSKISKDTSSMFGLPSFETKAYWAYARVPGAMLQFITGTMTDGSPIIDDSQRIKDISLTTDGNQTPADIDMSYMSHTIRVLRPPTPFKYAHYRQGGQWVNIELSTSMSSAINCEIQRSPNGTYRYATGDGPVNFGVRTCILDQDSPFIVLSNSADPHTGIGMGLYMSPTDPWNAQQMHIVNTQTLTTERTEDRRMFSQIRIAKWVGPDAKTTTGFWFLGAQNFLSGMLSPGSAATAYGLNHIEILTERSYTLFGTPQEIYNAILGAPLDTTPPTVSLTAPASSATVSGTIPVGATATDNVGVSGVQFVKNFFGNFFFGN